VLGLIIIVMEGDSEFPGWGNLIICVLATLIPAAIVNALLPPQAFLVGAFVGAITGGLAISWRCGMNVQRASIAAGAYLTFEIVFSLILTSMTKV
jgi:hypothetical protein